MKILIIHNEYGIFTGEEMVVASQKKLLEGNGHMVINYYRSSEELAGMPLGRTRAFLSGIYSRSSRRKVRQLLAEHQPDVVHIHNLYPLISPSILPVCRLAGAPVVMTVHNYRLVCPGGLHMVGGAICEKCGGGREYWCVIRNCEGNIFKSIGYAARNWVARKRRYYLDNVTMYAALTQFQRQRLIAEGYPADRIVVIPNMVDAKNAMGEFPSNDGSYAGYVGRISPEKDIPTLLAAAGRCPQLSFKAAGSYERMPHLLNQAPANFAFLGHLDPAGMRDFYSKARIVVLCSVCFEGFPMTIIEAMRHGKPVVCSRIGGLPEIVEDGQTGLLFEPGNAGDLAEKIKYLWDRPELCRKMGEAGRAKTLREYSPEKYYERLMAVYEKAVSLEIHSRRPLN